MGEPQLPGSPSDALAADDPTERLIAELAVRGLRIAVAESLTGGALAAEFVRIPGASRVFNGGIVAYSTALKHSLLGVDAGLLADRGAVDSEVARQLAHGTRHACAVEGIPADVGVSTTGVAGPTAQDGHAVGTVFIGLSTSVRTHAVRFAFTGTRSQIRAATVRASIAAVLAELAE